MNITLNFDTLAELQEFAQWANGRGQYIDQGPDKSSIPDTRPVTGEGAVIDHDEPQDVSEAEYEAAMSMLHGGEGPQDREPASAGAGEPPSTDPAPEAKPKRKRRTRAEIAADEAAAKAAEIAANAADESDKAANPLGAPQDDGPTNVPAHVPEQSTASPEQLPELLALAATIDGADKMAHMNEGREFISKHGFPKYNETFALADVPANIAAHTPEQGALHRAAMQWLAAQDGAK